MIMQLNISADENFIRIGHKSYATRQINSVDVRKNYPFSSIPALLCIFGVLFSMGAYAQGNKAGGIAGTLFFGAIAVLAIRRARTPEYLLFLTTSSKEVQAIKDSDPNVIDEIRSRIETAISNCR